MQLFNPLKHVPNVLTHELIEMYVSGTAKLKSVFQNEQIHVLDGEQYLGNILIASIK